MPTADIKKRVNIREMTIDDLPVVYHLGEDLFTSEEFPILYRTWDAYEVTNYFNVDSKYCLVAETDEEEEIVGFVIGTIFEKEGTAWKYGYIAWIGVKEEFQQTNLGRRLYKEVENEMKEEGVRMMIVDTEGDNQEAIAFFEKMGFSQRKAHVWMTKTLKKKKGKLPPLKGELKGHEEREVKFGSPSQDYG